MDSESRTQESQVHLKVCEDYNTVVHEVGQFAKKKNREGVPKNSLGNSILDDLGSRIRMCLLL